MRTIAIVGCRPPKAPRSADEGALFDAITNDVVWFLDALQGRVTIVSGGAVGVDLVASAWARAMGQRIIEHLPDYATHGQRAPLARNSLIVRDADEIHAWPAPWSRGTWDTIRKARERRKPTFVHEVTRAGVRVQASEGST